MPEQELTKPGKRGPAIGHPRWGGRKKTVSKAREIAESLGVDPIRWMLGLLKNGTYQATVIDPDGKKRKVTTVASLESREDLTPEQLENLSIHYVKTIDEVLELALPSTPREEKEYAEEREKVLTQPVA